MKLHLPLGLRAALLAVLSAASFSHANLWQMEGLSYNDNGGDFYAWNTFYTQAQGNFNKLVTITINNASWAIDRNVTFSAEANITATGGNAITVNRDFTFNFNQGSINSDGDFIVNGTFNLNGGYIGRNSSNVGSSSSIIVDGGTFNIHAPSETSTWGNAGIGYGEGTTHTIVLRNGGTFTLDGGHIARNKAHAEITVNTGTTFNLRDGYVGSESGSSVKIDITGTFNMSGGRIGSGLSPSKGTAEVNVESGGSFKISGGRLGYSGSIDLTVKSGGTMVISGGDFSLDDRGTLSFSGNGVNGADYQYGGNSALCVTTALEGYVKHNVTINGPTTFNIYNPGNEITFVGQFTFGGSTLNKVGQGSIIFTDARDSLQGTSGYFSTVAGDSGVVNINRGMVKFDFSASDAFRNFTFNLGYGANVTGTLFVAEGGSYVVRQLGGGITNNDTVTDGRGALTGGGTLIIDYSGAPPAVSAANVVADETEGAPSLTKRGSGEQRITGAVAAKDISVEQGTLTLGSEGHDVAAESISIAAGTTLNLGGDAAAGKLSSTGGSISASGSLEIGNVASGAQLTDLTLENGGTLAVGGGTLHSENVTITGDGTLTVNLTGDTHLDFGTFVHGNITLTLSDTYLLFDDDFTYQLFTDSYNSEWGNNITLTTTTVGRKSLVFNAENGSLAITGSVGDLTWAGGDLTWQDAANATREWQTENGEDRFYMGDSVTFDSAGGAVTLSGAIVAQQMSVASGEWSFTGDTGLEVVQKLAVAAGASATIATPTTVGGNVENEGTLTLNGETEIKGKLLSDGTLTVGGNIHVADAISLQGGTAQFSGSVTGNSITIENTRSATFSGDFNVYTGYYTTVRNSTVVFNGSSTRISALNISDGSHVTFSGTGLTLDNFYHNIDGGSEVHLALDLSAQENTTSSSGGYVLGKYIRLLDEDSRFVVQGYVNGQNMTYKYRQNYNLVYGKGTLVMLDTGYQVHNGDTPTVYWDDTVLYGDGILSRFMSRTSSAAETNTIRVLELASSENSEHPTVIVFNKYNSYAGYLLKHAQELHVKDGASLGFAYQLDREYDSITGPRNMWTTYAPNLVLHLAGTGAASGTEGTGKGAALFLTDSDGSDTTEHTVTVPWKIILDAATTINTVTAGAELLLTNELTNTGNYILTKQGKGKLTLGAGFRTAEASSGRIDVKAGSLVLGYSDENALKNFSLHVKPGSGVISLQGGSYAVKFLGNDVWTDNATPNSMISGGGTLIIDMPGDQTTANIGFAATDTGEKITLVKRGGGSQTLRGNATLNGLTMEGGTLILNGISTASTLTAKGGNLTVSSLTVDEAKGELGSLSVAANGTLKTGGGTLSGESISFVGAGTLNVSLAGKTHLNFGSVNLGGMLRLELADLFAPDGLDVGSPYQLFDADSWEQEWDANVNLVTTQLGRLEVGFKNGAIVVTGGERGDLTWASESANTWQAAASSDLFWTNAAGEQDFFYNGDNVTFATAGEHSISVVGTVSAGTMNVSEGAWNFAVGSSLAVAGKLTLEAGTSVTFSGESAALQGGAEVGSEATLAFTGTTAALGGTLELQGGTLSLSAAATTISGNIVATSGSVSVTNGSVSSTGSITLGSEDSTATMSVSSTGAKSLGDVTVNARSVFTVNTVTGWQAGGTRVSGAGTLALNTLGVQDVDATGGLLGGLISTAAVGAETAKLGVLKLTAENTTGTVLRFTGAGESLTNILNRVDEIHVGSRGSIGLMTRDSFAGTKGVLHLSGNGTGSAVQNNDYQRGNSSSLFAGNGVAAVMPWDVVLDGNTSLNPLSATSSITLTGALTSAGYGITKNGQGDLILGNGFTTKSAGGSEPDTGTIAVYRGALTLAYTDEEALSGYTISLAKGTATPYSTLNAEAGGHYVIKGITNVDAYEGGYITGEGTLAVSTAGGSYTSSADVTPGADASLTLEKLGEGTQAITGDVSLAALKVTEGTLALGSAGKTVTVLGAAAVEGTLSMGTSLTLGTLSGAGSVTGSGTLSGDISAFTGSIETDGTWQLTDSADGVVVLQASFAGSGSIELAYAAAESITLNGAAKESVSLDHSGSAKLTLTAQNTSTGALTLHDNAAQLGTETAAAAWAGSVAGSGTLTLVNGELAQAVTNSNISLHVDARGAVNAGGTAGAALKSVAIREGGRLTGVSGNIEVSAAATQSMQLTFGTGNIGLAGQALIEAGGVRVAESGAFAIDFTSDVLVEILKMDGAEVQLQVVSGGALDLGNVESLSDIAGGYAELLLAYSRVQAEDGALVLLGEEEEPPVVDPDDPVDPNPPVVDPDEPVDPNPPVVDPDEPVGPNPPVTPDEPTKRVYLVLADGSADASTIRDYTALDDRIATVLDAGTQLTLELADSAEHANTITVKNLVGLSGTALVARCTGKDGLTVELDNTLQDVKDDATLPDGMNPQSARGFDTEFEGLIVGEAGVNFVKTGAGTLTVGSKPLTRSAEQGGVQIEEDLEIQQGSIVIRGGDASRVGSLSFNYNESPSQSDEQRGLVLSGAGLTVGALHELGERGEDNAISLERGGELILTGSDRLESTHINAGEGGGLLNIAEEAGLTLVHDAALSGVDVQVSGGELALEEGADMVGGALTVYSGGSVALGSGASIREAGDIDIHKGGAVGISSGSEGLHAIGAINLEKGAELSLGEGTQSRAAGLNGSGLVQGEKGSLLGITGSGSVFSGELAGAGSLSVDENADFTLSGITTAESACWDARVRENGVLTVDVTRSELDTTLGDITLGNSSKLIYRFVNEASPRLNAHISIEGGDSAEFVIESYGRAVEAGEELDLGVLTYSGAAEDLTVRLKGTTFAYFEGTLYWDTTDGNLLKVGLAKSEQSRNKFITGDMEANARAGAELLWAALNPNGAAWAHITENPEGDLAQLINTLYSRAEERQDVSRELAASAGSAIATLGAAASEDMRRQLNNLRNRATMNDFSSGKAVWVNAESSYRKQHADGLAPGYTLNGWGGSVGYEGAVGHNMNAGLSLTAMYNDLKTSSADQASGDMDTTSLGVWARVMKGAWMHSFIASAGLVDATLNRTVSYGEGLSYNTQGSTDGYTLGAMYELGYTRLLGTQGNMALQPVANIQLRHTALSGYTESGSDAGLRVDDISQTTVTLGFGVRVQGALSAQALGRSAWFELRVLAKADVGDRNGEAKTSLLYGEQSAKVKSAELGATGVELGVGLSLPLRSHGSVFADASTELRSGYTAYSAAAGYKLNF